MIIKAAATNAAGRTGGGWGGWGGWEGANVGNAVKMRFERETFDARLKR